MSPLRVPSIFKGIFVGYLNRTKSTYISRGITRVESEGHLPQAINQQRWRDCPSGIILVMVEVLVASCLFKLRLHRGRNRGWKAAIASTLFPGEFRSAVMWHHVTASAFSTVWFASVSIHAYSMTVHIQKRYMKPIQNILLAFFGCAGQSDPTFNIVAWCLNLCVDGTGRPYVLCRKPYPALKHRQSSSLVLGWQKLLFLRCTRCFKCIQLFSLICITFLSQLSSLCNATNFPPHALVHLDFSESISEAAEDLLPI